MPVRPNDGRLAWLAAHDELDRRARKLGVMGWVLMVCTLGFAAKQAKRVRRGRMTLYSIGVDEAAQRLSAEERIALRERRELPDWFFPEVERHARAARRA